MILRAFSKTNFIISIKIFIEIIKAKSSHAIKMFEPLLSVRRYSHGNLQHHWNNSRHREPDGDRIHRAEQGKIFRPFLTFGLFNPKGAFTLPFMNAFTSLRCDFKELTLLTTNHRQIR